MKIAMWSGPRNLSTAMMYAFAARGDCAVWDEPFYAAYLRQTVIDHPMRDQIIAAHESDPAKVAATCIGEIPQAQSLFYQKHMTLHMIPQFDRQFMRDLTNVFLIRHPARVVASYAKKREGPTLMDIGFVQQAELFDQVADWMGEAPLVIDSADLRADPYAALNNLCDALGILFIKNMLHWPAGPKPYDGVWGPHWYGAVHRSTGFEDPEGPLPDLPSGYQSIVDQALPYYKKLAAFKM
ncbi:MAG: HAD family hydrolase [Pseudotabrizicola sp.]|uniref:sulfotransferase-like domain-containing protein n=1 Tax=Pseudotabrizicola sp. TaxID=2939647 RepID=UPI00272F8F82|nr:HAD family hydrolase [Pseudotabrizicola sp.]MDP2083373.1 HAD family hydrolase [Pseudotabrizicola sp.]MDZ7574911.1 HAD family hydrolase [Pseudotabrizicola sp.]